MKMSSTSSAAEEARSLSSEADNLHSRDDATRESSDALDTIDDETHEIFQHEASFFEARTLASFDKTALVNEFMQVKENLKNAHATVSNAKAALALQKQRTRQSIAAWRHRVEECYEKINKQKTTHDKQMAEIVANLLYFEGQLRKEQKFIVQMMEEKDATIMGQQRRIESLTAANERLMKAISKLQGKQPNARLTHQNGHLSDEEVSALMGATSLMGQDMDFSHSEHSNLLTTCAPPTRVSEASILGSCHRKPPMLPYIVIDKPPSEMHYLATHHNTVPHALIDRSPSASQALSHMTLNIVPQVVVNESPSQTLSHVTHNIQQYFFHPNSETGEKNSFEATSDIDSDNSGYEVNSNDKPTKPTVKKSFSARMSNELPPRGSLSSAILRHRGLGLSFGIGPDVAAHHQQIILGTQRSRGEQNLPETINSRSFFPSGNPQLSPNLLNKELQGKIPSKPKSPTKSRATPLTERARKFSGPSQFRNWLSGSDRSDDEDRKTPGSYSDFETNENEDLRCRLPRNLFARKQSWPQGGGSSITKTFRSLLAPKQNSNNDQKQNGNNDQKQNGNATPTSTNQKKKNRTTKHFLTLGDRTSSSEDYNYQTS